MAITINNVGKKYSSNQNEAWSNKQFHLVVGKNGDWTNVVGQRTTCLTQKKFDQTKLKKNPSPLKVTKSIKEGRKEGVVDERTTDTPSLQYVLT